MFGHDDQSHHQDENQPAPDAALAHDAGMGATPVDDTAGDYIDDGPGAPAAPATNDTAAPVMEPALPAAPAMPALPAAGSATSSTDELLDIKQQALQQLTPLVGHLDQSPEEKFRTTMMMIQASDNDALIKDAYDAAVQIADEKTRAQALWDIVNEINYFTHSAAADEA